MSTSKETLAGPGRFQWNAGGWFGSSLGGSAWMIVVAFVLALHDQPKIALVPTAGFATILTASLFLWAHRDKIHPFPAYMALLGLLAIEIPLVSIVVPTFSSRAALAAMNWPASFWPTVLACAIAPVLMIWFLVLERSATTKSDPKKFDSTRMA